MNKKGIYCRPFFYPLSSQRAYYKYKKNSKKININSYSISKRGILLPSSINLTPKDIEHISKNLLKLIKNNL